MVKLFVLRGFSFPRGLVALLGSFILLGRPAFLGHVIHGVAIIEVAFFVRLTADLPLLEGTFFILGLFFLGLVVELTFLAFIVRERPICGYVITMPLLESLAEGVGLNSDRVQGAGDSLQACSDRRRDWSRLHERQCG